MEERKRDDDIKKEELAKTQKHKASVRKPVGMKPIKSEIVGEPRPPINDNLEGKDEDDELYSLLNNVIDKLAMVRTNLLKKAEEIKISVGDKELKIRRGFDIEEVDLEIHTGYDHQSGKVAKLSEDAVKLMFRIKLKSREMPPVE